MDFIVLVLGSLILFYWMTDNVNFTLLNPGFVFSLNIFELYSGTQLSYLEGV